MHPEKFALAVGAAVFAGGSLGLVLHRVLPEKHVTGGAKDMIGAVVGLLTLLSALVLGLLIWTAYGVYAGQNVAIQTLAAKVLQFDVALSDYGAEANHARTQLRQAGQDNRRDLGREPERRQFRRQQFHRGDPERARSGGDPGRAQAVDGCADTGACGGEGDAQLDRPIAIADVLRAGHVPFPCRSS